ncbi:MAG: agmatine deiminase family protein [Bacteroidales bacterium]|jgi:agmatine deiminase|nr:agmatine deiminase family protein [Bacteroidales bacterium]
MFLFPTLTPKQLGYSFPAEWERHRATWLSYPHDDSYSWPGTLNRIFPVYNRFIKELTKGEQVCINVRNEALAGIVTHDLSALGIDMAKISLYIHPTNDAWCRDHGPAFLLNKGSAEPKIIVSWKYNAWGNKYDHELDEQIPGLIAKALNIPVFYPGIVMEGGAVDFNGNGTLLTTMQCLLHENRNPDLLQHEIEDYLRNFYGVDQVLWLDEGIAGDDTNGHIDDISRFFREDGMITMVETRRSDDNYPVLKEALKKLKTFRLPDNKQLDIAEIPMPRPVIYEGQRLPASYANFYIANNSVIVPNFRCSEDDRAMQILEECFPGRTIIGIDSVDIIWGLGSFHCLSQQEPE